MDTVIAVLALLFVLFLALGAYATVKAVGAAKRGVDRTLTQARRTVEDTTLRVRTLALPGPAGELAQLRLRLRTSLRATREALEAGATEDASLKESLGLFERLGAHGRQLDEELRRLEGEPDRSGLARRLPELRERTERITKSADSLRWAAHERARRFTEDDLSTLSGQIDIEAGALRHWTTEPAPGRDTAAAEPAPPERGERATGKSAAQTDPPVRPAVAPPAPRATYPWDKKPRPETTT
ncbi:hypothetical protein ACIBWG_00370 [Streptomyces griseoaurantiacus]|uniref:hypothetical protein n=1 Tax=Streptomyces TaxID=1883 RepID=UPI0029BE9091|nr:hypothetical protein [Streptomyces sp. ME02-6978.2a]MDX3362884.1 hypothetical protein [Streptomyces sp. ME02-6978.2a]